MLESVLAISISGLLAGFIFAMPIAGPISILITSNALKGNLRYCNLVTLGASLVDFAFVFTAVYGLTSLYKYYEPVIPFIFLAGSIFFLLLGYKIFRTKIDIEHLGKSHLVEKFEKKEKGAFYTGFMINFLNPTLFIGAVTSSFFVISLISAMGFHTGGLAAKLSQNFEEINKIEGGQLENSRTLTFEQFDKILTERKKDKSPEPTNFPQYFHLVVSLCYAFFLSMGTILWFYLLAFMLVRFRKRFNVKVISIIIKSLGIVLAMLGIFFGYRGVFLFIN